MTKPHYRELVFDVTEAEEGGFNAGCVSEGIFTQGDTWEDLRANVKDAVEAFFFDGPKPQVVRLRLSQNQD